MTTQLGTEQVCIEFGIAAPDRLAIGKNQIGANAPVPHELATDARATTIGSAASPGSGFLTGTEPPKSRRPLSSGFSVVVVFLIQWAAERRGGGFLGCRAPPSRA